RRRPHRGPAAERGRGARRRRDRQRHPQDRLRPRRGRERAPARGRDRRPRGLGPGDPLGPLRGRDRRARRELPPRFRVAPQVGSGEPQVIARLIELSARNRFLVLFVTAVLVVLAVVAVKNVPLDAIPDLSDTQVVLYTRWDRSPDIIEDQITY